MRNKERKAKMRYTEVRLKSESQVRILALEEVREQSTKAFS